MELWRWYIPDLKGKLRPSTWRMTEADAQARYPGCKRVEGSLEARNEVRGASHTMASGLVRRDDGAMMPPDTRRGPAGQADVAISSSAPASCARAS